MTQSLLHTFMINELAAILMQAECDVRCEYPIRERGDVWYADLHARIGTLSILLECETTPRRVDEDLIKLSALTRADGVSQAELWIVVPNVSVRSAVNRRLNRLLIPMAVTDLNVYTLATAKTKLSELVVCANPDRERNC